MRAQQLLPWQRLAEIKRHDLAWKSQGRWSTEVLLVAGIVASVGLVMSVIAVIHLGPCVVLVVQPEQAEEVGEGAGDWGEGCCRVDWSRGGL